MKQFSLLLFIVLICFISPVKAQTTGDYRSLGTGVPVYLTTTTNWQTYSSTTSSWSTSPEPGKDKIRLQHGTSNINVGGILPFLYYDVLYDAKNGIIGLRLK